MNTELKNFHGCPVVLLDSRLPKNEITFLSYTRDANGELKPRMVRITNIGSPDGVSE